MDKDISWFLGFIAIFVFLWIGSGGVNNPAKTRDPYIKPITEGGYTYGGEDTGSNEKLEQSKTSIGNQLDSSQKEAERIQSDLEDLAKYSELNGKITIKKNYYTYGTITADKEQLIITSSSRNKDPIKLTGLILKSPVTGRTATINRGSKLIRPGTSGGYDDIYLEPGSRAYITTGSSPAGESFLLNKCTGYFEQNNNFSPRLPRQCPYIKDQTLPSSPNQFNDQCLDYLEKISRCTIPEKIPEYITNSCQSFVAKEATYNSCVANYRNDSDFYKTEWRIYLERNDTLWKTKRETIQLLDSSGKIIDEISY